MPLTRPEVATIALLDCGGERDTVHTEDVALKAAEIAPGMFAWEKHADRIDKELVRVALSDARIKKKYALGSHDRGWMLTPAGLAFAQAHQTAAPVRISPTRRRGKADLQISRERARLIGSVAFEKFRDGQLDAITDDDADAFFRLNVYVRGQARQRKIARTQNEFGNDPELGVLINHLADTAHRRI